MILTLKELRCSFKTSEGLVRAVDGAEFELSESEFLCIVGESGAGKSVMLKSILGIINSKSTLMSGEIRYKNKFLFKNNLPHNWGIDLNDKKKAVKNLFNRNLLEKIRGSEISMIFQDPVSSLNPYFTVGQHLEEAYNSKNKNKNDKRKIAIDWLSKVKISEADKVIDYYPHQLSGGMAQRVMIALALINNPKILLADEPTTSLDSTVQKEILDLLKKLQNELKLSIILITHDMGLAYHYSDSIAVMYAGRIVEFMKRDALNNLETLHPYTQGLINSIPWFGEESNKMNFIKGEVPNNIALPSGCKFHPRCELKHRLNGKVEKCSESEPDFFKVSQLNKAKCWLYEK